MIEKAPFENEVAAAVAFRERVPRTRNVARTHNSNSYVLKHAAERFAGVYVSNAALIAAAHRLLFQTRAIPDSPNMFIGVTMPRHWLMTAEERRRALGRKDGDLSMTIVI